MPNWCTTNITFMSDGTPEGKLALQEFRNKFELADKIKPDRSNSYLWEIDVEMAHLQEGNGLFMFGATETSWDGHKYYNGTFNCCKRGYIYYIGDIEEYSSYDEFSISCDDAWAGNIGFWQVLLSTFYGNKITFRYDCTEPGMGLYYTNDPFMTDEHTVFTYAEGADCFNLPGCIVPELSEGPFVFMNKSNPYLNIDLEGYRGWWSDYSKRYVYSYGIPISFEMDIQGSEYECKNQISKYVMGRQETDPNNTLEELVCSAEDTYGCEVSHHEYEYSSIEQEASNETRTLSDKHCNLINSSLDDLYIELQQKDR